MSRRFSIEPKAPARPTFPAPQHPPVPGTDPTAPLHTPANRPPQWRPIAASRSGVRAPSRHTVIGSPSGHDPGAPPPLTPRRPARDAAPGGSARDALLGGDPPLLVREASPGRPTRFRFTRSIDPATHHALIAAACAEWFASPAPQDPQEGLAFLDAVIDQADTPTLSHQLLDRHGDALLTLAPPPWDSGRLSAIATCLHALGHQLTRHTPAALRRLVLAFHPEAEVATALRELSATVQALEQAKAPLSANDAQQLVQRLYHLSRQALDLGSHALVRTAVDLAQRVANGAAPTGRANPAAVQALVNVMVQSLPPELSGVTTLRINDWLFLNIAWPPGPDGRRLLDVRVKQELIDRAPETARRELLQWAHEQQAQGTDALPWAELQALVDELMPCLHRPLSLEERLALCRDEALLRLNPQPLLNLLSSWLDGAPADAGLLHELLERYRRPDVPAERRLALLRGALPLLPHPFDDPRLHLAYRQLIDTLPDNDAARAALEQHEAAVRPQRAPPNAPSGYVRQRLQDRARHEAPPGPSGPAAEDDPLPPPDEACAWFGPAFATSEADVGEALDRLFSGASAPLRHNFQHDTFELTVHRSDALLPHLPAVSALCAAWFRDGQAPRAIALLGLVLSAVDDLGAHYTLLAAHAAALNDSPASAWAGGQGGGVLDAIRALGASGWFLADTPRHLTPPARLALLQLLGRFDPVAAISLAASELGHRLSHRPVPAPAPTEGKHLADLLGLLLRLGSEQNDPAVLKQAQEGAKALAAACGSRPTGGAAVLQARFHQLVRAGHQALAQVHIAQLSDWLTLEWKRGSGSQPDTLSRIRVRQDGGAFKRPKDLPLALSALMGFIDGQLAHPQGVPWGQLVQLAVTVSATLERPFDALVWWHWCVAEAQRTGKAHALQYQLEHRQSIHSPDSPLFDDLLSVCGDPRLSESDRAALLRTACQQLQLAAASNDARDDAARARVVAWLHEQAGRTGGLPLVAIHALWPALPWPLGPGEWLNLCLSDARQRGQPQALIDWLKAPPPDDHRFIDKELFQDVLDIAQNAPLNHGDRRRLLLAAQALLNEHLRDVPLQARCADALRELRSPRKGGGGYPQAYQTLFQNSPRLFSPPGDERPDTFQLNQPVLSPGEVDALITVCDTWAQGMQMQKVQKLLDAVLRGTQDLSLHRRLLTLYADRLAALRPQAAQQTQWQGILSAIAGLARQGWATAGHTHETDAATRTVLRTLVRAIDWGQYAHIELSAIEHQIQHLPAPPLRGDTGRALLEQLTRLSLASIGKDDALVAQRTLRLARALARRLGEDHELQAALKPLFTEVSQRWLDQARPALHPWFVLQRSTAPSSSPRAGQARLTYGWSGADKTLATPEQQANAWRALLQWVRIELENPQGPVWADMRALLELVESAWKRPLDDRQWLALCLLEVSRTGGLSSLNQRLAMQRARPLDEAMLRKLLALASEARFPTADRAALLRHLAQKLPPYEAHTALHEDFLRVLFRRFEPDTGKVLLRTYRDSLSPAGKGLVALVELVARLENEDYRSSESAWKRFGEAPHPDARVDWDHWRRLCGQLARSMAERIQRFQTASFPSADRQRFNTLVVQVLWRLSAQAKTRASTAIDRQFELLGDLVQALPEEHREAFLHQLDATCTQLIATALQPGDTAPAPPMPIPLLALQGAVRALATRRGGQVATPPATDRPSTVERAVQDFSDVFRAVRASRTGDLKALRNAHRSAQERGDFTSSPSPYPREVAGALIELLARHIDH